MSARRVWLVIAAVSLVGAAVYADAPAGRYSANNATVKDLQTGLTWQLTLDSNTHTWSDANTYCQQLALTGTGWRLPTLKELLTLVDVTRIDPAISPNDFPDTPSAVFWSASRLVGPSNRGWHVQFANGSTDNSDLGQMYRVRCVR